MGGTREAAKILSGARKATEQRVMPKLFKIDRDVAKAIEEAMFVFDNLLELDDKDLGTLIRNVKAEAWEADFRVRDRTVEILIDGKEEPNPALIARARELVAGLPDATWAVVTSAVRALAEARLAAAGLPRPDVLVTADDVARGKPAPDGYRRAAALLGLPVTDCLVLEDSAAGVAAGRAAGARVLGVSRRALDTDADLVVTDLRGLRFDGAAVQVAADAVLGP